MKLTGTVKVFFVCSLSVLSLFLGFFMNYWHVADRPWFDNFLHDMESYIVGRMVQSRQDGILSSGGLTGVGSFNATPVHYSDRPFSNQYLAYLNDLPFETYSTYDSQIGGQGILFSVLDKLISVSPQEKLRFFNALTSLLSAIVLTAIIVWFYLEFGLTVSLFVLLSAVFSQWLTVFGRNLWWSMWAFFLPVVAVMYYLRAAGTSQNAKRFELGVIVLVTVFLKCLFTGYEFITSALVMMVVPLAYYIILNRVNVRESLKSLGIVALASCLGILLSFTILCFQVASVRGHFVDGVNHIVDSFEKRSYANPRDFPSYAPGLEASTASVVIKYLNATFFDVKNSLSASNPLALRYSLEIKYSHLILLFAMMSILLYFQKNCHVVEEEARKRVALIGATWVSILAPLSWFIIFKAHSYVHTGMNAIVWQMPFVLFGFAVCGLVVRNFLMRRGTYTSPLSPWPRVTKKDAGL